MIDVKIEMCVCLNDGELYDEFKPFKAHESDAAYDIMAAVDDKVVLKPFETKVIPAGFKIELPIGYEAQIRGRSGNALKRKIQIANAPGTIDSGYRGEVGVIIFNANPVEELVIKRGEKIAQMVIAKLPDAQLVFVDSIDTESERGENGFGSTGK